MPEPRTEQLRRVYEAAVDVATARTPDAIAAAEREFLAAAQACGDPAEAQEILEMLRATFGPLAEFEPGPGERPH